MRLILDRNLRQRGTSRIEPIDTLSKILILETMRPTGAVEIDNQVIVWSKAGQQRIGFGHYVF